MAESPTHHNFCTRPGGIKERNQGLQDYLRRQIYDNLSYAYMEISIKIWLLQTHSVGKQCLPIGVI